MCFSVIVLQAWLIMKNGYIPLTRRNFFSWSRRNEKKFRKQSVRTISNETAPVKWAVDGFLPVGLSILTGRTKVGKSILALNLSIGVATGLSVLGHFNAVKGGVLYLALEDTMRRLHDRIKSCALIEPDTDLSGLCVFTGIPHQHSGGLEYIRYWLSEHEDTRLVVIDTLQMFMERLSGKGSAYREDYQAASEIKQLANEFNVAVLAVYPLGENTKGDWVSEFSGSRGIVDVADTIFVLERNFKSRTGVLRRFIRGMAEEQFSLKFSPHGWTMAGQTNC